MGSKCGAQQASLILRYLNAFFLWYYEVFTHLQTPMSSITKAGEKLNSKDPSATPDKNEFRFFYALSHMVRLQNITLTTTAYN